MECLEAAVLGCGIFSSWILRQHQTDCKNGRNENANAGTSGNIFEQLADV